MLVTSIVGDENRYIFKHKSCDPIFFLNHQLIVSDTKESEYYQRMFLKFLHAANHKIETTINTQWVMKIGSSCFYFIPTNQAIKYYFNVPNTKNLLNFIELVMGGLLKLEHHPHATKFLNLFETPEEMFLVSPKGFLILVNNFLKMNKCDWSSSGKTEVKFPKSHGTFLVRKMFIINPNKFDVSTTIPYLSVDLEKVLVFLSIADPKLHIRLKSDLDYQIIKSY